MQVKDPETKTAKWNSAFNNFIFVLLFLSALFLLRHLKMATLKKDYLFKFKLDSSRKFNQTRRRHAHTVLRRGLIIQRN